MKTQNNTIRKKDTILQLKLASLIHLITPSFGMIWSVLFKDAFIFLSIMIGLFLFHISYDAMKQYEFTTYGDTLYHGTFILGIILSILTLYFII